MNADRDGAAEQNGGSLPNDSAQELLSHNGSTPPADALAELRHVLLGPDRIQLAHLEKRVEDRAPNAEEVARVLVDAIRMQTAESDRLADSLAPLLEKGLHVSVQRNPGPLIDVIFPIIGPAIRKSVVAAIESMVQTINQLVEHTFSPKAVAWRWEAYRAGRPYAEIVLKHSLVFHVVQGFLIHRESGLLVQHVADSKVVIRDEDMVSGMLTAIQEFVKDSFSVGRDEELEALRVGELTVWIEQGPAAFLALVLRGSPPQTLKDRMREVLETVHKEYGIKLRSFSGDVSEFAPAVELLQECLSAGEATAETITNQKKARNRRRRLVWSAIGIIVLGLVVWAFASMIRSSQRNAAWAECIQRLDQQPGIVVIQSGKRDGRYFVRVLRDPRAADARTALAGTSINPDDVIVEERPYQSLENELEPKPQ